MKSGVFAYQESGLLAAGQNTFEITHAHPLREGQAVIDWLEVV
jgi:hypothetical protein